MPIGKGCNNGKYGYICLLCASPAGTKSTRIFNLKGGAEVHARSCTGGLKKPDGGWGVRPGWEQERPLVFPLAVDWRLVRCPTCNQTASERAPGEPQTRDSVGGHALIALLQAPTLGRPQLRNRRL